METKRLRICLLWVIMVIWTPQNVMAETYYEYDHTENVTIECGEIKTLDPTTLSGEAGYYFRYYYNRPATGYGQSWCWGGNDGLEKTNDYPVWNSSNYYDSYKCDVIGLKPGTYKVDCIWYVWSKYISSDTGQSTDWTQVICRYIITVKSTSNPQITLAVSDTCKRVVKGTNIIITPSVSGASVYYSAPGKNDFWVGTLPSSGITLNEISQGGYNTSIRACAVKRGYPASEKFSHNYEVIEPGDFHVLLTQGADVHFKVISESNKTCGVYFVPETATGELRIPSQINGYKVTYIQNDAFKNCKNLTSVVLPEGIEFIGDRAFYGCTALTTINIPNTLTTIGGFSGSGLEHIDIPSSVTKIEWGAFSDCNKLKTVIMHEGLKEIDSYAFENCSSLEKFVIPSTVENIGQMACYRCECLEEIVIPNSVKEIGVFAFSGCTSLESVYSFIENPFPINETIFGIYTNGWDDWSWTSATLYVPKGCKETYASTGGWLLFNYIEEIGGSEPIDEEDTDISQLDNIIYMKPQRVDAGSRTTLSFHMKNTADIRSFQFDLYLPAGIIPVKSSKGRIQGNLSNGRLPEEDKHTLTFQEQLDGAIRFICNSPYEETFTGNEGEIATLEVNISENMADGAYPVVLKNMRLSEIDESKYYESNNVKTTLTIGEEKVCAKPIISYAYGKLTFSCETEGAVCQSTITDADINSFSGNEVELTVTYNISVYATKAGYEDSEVATATLCWIDQQPDTEGIIDEDAVAEVKALPVLIQTQGGIITVQGTDDGTPITIYGTDGKMYGSAASVNGIATLNTSLQPGSVAIVKIGGKSIKALMK